MSQSAIFRLVVRDDRYDNLFTASDYLRKRLQNIRRTREKNGELNVQPTFVDLQRTHLMFLRGTYRPFVANACEYVRVKPSGDAAALTLSGGTAVFRFPIYGHFTSDIVCRVKLSAVGTLNPVISTGSDASPYYRYCAFPGMRILQKVSFKSDGTLIDDYTADETVFKNDFRIPADRRYAWNRGMGQAEIKTAEYFNNNGYTGVLTYKEGMQSRMFYHPEQDLWIPLDFWMCDDAANALLNDLIPNTQREITIDLAKLSDILQAVDQNSGEVIPLPIGRLPITIDLYVNNIFVNPEIHDIFATRVGMSLIRVHRRQTKILTMSQSSILMDQLKYPAEFLYLGIRDRANLSNFDHWYLFGRRRVRTDATSLMVPAVIWNSALMVDQIVIRQATETSTLDPIVSSLQFTAHGIDLYPEMPIGFYNTYLPQRYFNYTAIVSPQDSSVVFVPFCLYPGKYNPSGYFNLSASREFYVTYKSESIDADQTAELVVSMSALNFLVRKGDKAHLRYTT